MFCPQCGKEVPEGLSLCQECGAQMPAKQEATAAPLKPENVLTGTVGAILGAAIGAVAIILLSQLGLVASISGLILAVCTLKGYELLGGRLTTRGIMISCVLILVTPYIADRIDWAILLVKEYPNVTFAEAFEAVPRLLDMGFIVPETYWTSLIMVYLFAILGAAGTAWSAIKGSKK